MIVIDPLSIALKESGEAPGSIAVRVNAWRPGAWYPLAKPDLSLALAPFPDPGGEATYFKVPNPDDPAFVDDELIGAAGL